MNLGVFILILFGGVIGIGIIIDLISKLRSKKLNFDSNDNNKNIGTSERIYSENYKDKIKQDIDQGFF